MKVNTGQITEMLSVVGLLQTILGATGERFFDFLPATAETLARILGAAGSACGGRGAHVLFAFRWYPLQVYFPEA